MKADLVKAASEVILNQQILVNMISRRVRQLSFGHRPMVEYAPGLGSARMGKTRQRRSCNFPESSRQRRKRRKGKVRHKAGVRGERISATIAAATNGGSVGLRNTVFENAITRFF